MKLFVLLLTWQLASSATIKSACKVAQITDAGALLMDGGESQYSDAVAVSCNPHVTVARSSCIVAADTGITIAGNCRESGFRDGPRLYSRFQNIAVFASYTRGDTMFALTDASGMLRLGNELNVASRPTDATISALAVGVMGARLARKLPLGEPVHFPVTAVLCGRRNNCPEPPYTWQH